jgi:hypothetical protein
MSTKFNFLKKKHPIFRKIRENFGNVQIIQKIIQNYSVVSLLTTYLRNSQQRAALSWACPTRQGERNSAETLYALGDEPFVHQCNRCVNRGKSRPKEPVY